MTNTDKEPTGDIAVVKKEENTSQAHIKASNERIRQMDQLQRKLKSKKHKESGDLDGILPKGWS